VFVDPQGNFFYVTLLGSANVLKYDAWADTLVAVAAVGQAPANPVTSPDGRTLYVTNWRSDNPTLHVLDAATLAEREVLRFPPSLGASPHGLCVARDGTVYTTHEEAGSVFEIGPGGPVFIPLEGRESRRLQPLQIVLDADERFAYVTCLNAGEVQVIDIELDAVVKVISIGGNPWLAALTLDGSRVYVANWGKNAVDVIETSTQELVATLTNQTVGKTVFARPHGVAMSADGTQVFISNENTNGTFPPHHGGETSGNGNVVVIDVATNEVVKVLEVEVDPTGIAFGAH